MKLTDRKIVKYALTLMHKTSLYGVFSEPATRCRLIFIIAPVISLILISVILGLLFADPSVPSLPSASDTPGASLINVPDAAYARGESLAVGADSAFAVINPIFSAGDGENDAVSLLFEPLVRLDVNGKPEGVLASSWQFDRDSSNLTFSMAAGHLFTSGNAVTAEDVLFTYSCLFDPSYDGPLQGRFSDIIKVSSTGPDIVSFKLNSAVENPDFCLFSVGILEKARYQTRPGQIYTMGTDAGPPSGSGAYELKSMTENQAVLSLRANFTGQVKRIIIRQIPSAEKFSEILSGNLDLVRCSWDLRMQEREPALTGYDAVHFSASVSTYFMVNPELNTQNIIQLPSQRLGVLLAATGRPLSSLQLSALEGLAGKTLELYYFAGFDEQTEQTSLSTASDIAKRLTACGLSIELVALSWPDLAKRASSGDYDILLLPATANNRLPARTVLLGDEVQPAASAFIASRREEVVYISKRLTGLDFNVHGHPYAALAGTWTDHLDQVKLLDKNGTVLEEGNP